MHAPPEKSAPRAESLFWKTRWPAFLLLAGDVFGFAICWWAAYEARLWLGTFAMGPINEFAPYLQVFPLVVLIGIGTCFTFGMYVHRRRVSSLTRWGSLLKAGYHYVLFLMVMGYFWKELDLGRSVIMLAGAMSFVYLYTSRTVFRTMKEDALARGIGRVRALIVGAGPMAGEVRAALDAHADVGYDIVGFAPHHGERPDEALEGLPLLGASADLAAVIARHGIEEVFIAVPHLPQDEQLGLVELIAEPGVRIHLVSDLFDVLTRGANVEEIGQFPVVTLRDGYQPYQRVALKRLLDVAAGALGCALWLLCFHWWIALLIRRDSPGPVFFAQERVGQGGRVFRLYKYRTMHTSAPAYERAPTAEDDPRITRFGRWLRHTSLDELPQLWNVLKGEMSLVGPRPEMPFIVAQYRAWQRRRLDVKPGLTGLWQVIGRKNLPLHLNMEYDFYYIKNQSFLMDLEILIRTIPAVVKGRGAF
ncbi:MAG: sugar transferase [Candidatus Sumerlaeia bacterium]|nr:sugar transferase [Candidatus Sumerlaeia bacterium]